VAILGEILHPDIFLRRSPADAWQQLG